MKTSTFTKRNETAAAAPHNKPTGTGFVLRLSWAPGWGDRSSRCFEAGAPPSAWRWNTAAPGPAAESATKKYGPQMVRDIYIYMFMMDKDC